MVNVPQDLLLDVQLMGTNLLYSNAFHVPSSLKYQLLRFEKEKDDVFSRGLLSYFYHRENKSAQNLSLQFCMTGNRYCSIKNCSNCRIQQNVDCRGQIDTIDVFTFDFQPTFLLTFVKNNPPINKREEVFSFNYPHSFTDQVVLCDRKKKLLNKLQQTYYCSALQNVVFNAVAQELLLFSSEYLVENSTHFFNCRFLADDSSVKKMYKARDILLENIDSLISIKELSKQVAINECYLKKGFKEVFGITIYDFYLQQKMEHAKYLLYEEGLTVTEVAARLGYSSISHFSTAFKRQTGLKPCDLLK